MKLYDSRRAPNPRRVRWVMAEKGIDDIEVVDIDIFQGAHKTPEYRAAFGFANVPALELDDGTGITESVAIARYLEALHPEPNLFGHDARETAIIEMWMRRVEMGLSTPCMLSVRFGHPALAALETPDPAYVERNRAQAEGMMKVLDRRLADRDFIAADRLTIVDILAYTGLDFARMVKLRPAPELTHIGRWFEMMKARPAAAAGV